MSVNPSSNTPGSRYLSARSVIAFCYQTASARPVGGSAGALAAGRLERGIEIRGPTYRQGLKLHAERGRRRRGRTELGVAGGSIPQDGHAADGRNHLFQEL